MRQTSGKVTIWDISIEFWVIIFTFGIAGAAFIISSFSVTTFTCQRRSPTEGSCKLVDLNLPWPNIREIPLNTLQGASFISSFGGRSSSYKIVLLTQSGKIYIANSSHSGEKEYIATQIDDFIRNPSQKFLKVRQDGQREDFFEGLLFWSGGAIGLLFVGDPIEFLTCSVDKKVGRITLKQRNFPSLSTGLLEWSLEEIESVAVESCSCYSLNRYGQYITYNKYFLVLVLKSGERLRLTWYETALLKNKQKIVKFISSFLHLNKNL